MLLQRTVCIKALPYRAVAELKTIPLCLTSVNRLTVRAHVRVKLASVSCVADVRATVSAVVNASCETKEKKNSRRQHQVAV